MKDGPLARRARPQIAEHRRPTEITTNRRLPRRHILEQAFEEALETRVVLPWREPVTQGAIDHVHEPLGELNLGKSAAADAQRGAAGVRLVRFEQGDLRIVRLAVELVLVEGLPAFSARKHEALARIIVDLDGEPARRASRYP